MLKTSNLFRVSQCLLVTALLVVGVTLFTNQSTLTAQSASAPTAVATVDLNAVISQSKANTAQEEARAGRDAARQTEGQTKNVALQKAQADLDLLAPGSQARQDKQNELQSMLIEARVWEQMSQAQEQATRSRNFLAMYEAANEAVAAVAEERGLDIVLTAGQLPEMSRLAQADAQQIAAILQNRKVLYTSAQADITQAVLARMNADFDAGN
jgi:Skp family chaperone for outer membrane proteins